MKDQTSDAVTIVEIDDEVKFFWPIDLMHPLALGGRGGMCSEIGLRWHAPYDTFFYQARCEVQISTFSHHDGANVGY